MKRALSFPSLACAALAAACGTLLANSGDDDPPPPAPAMDGAADAVSTVDGGSSADVEAPKLRVCPTAQCPNEEEAAGEKCTDDLCEPLDWDVAGGSDAVTATGGSCVVASRPAGQEAYLFNDAERDQETLTASLSFDLIAWDTTDRTIASVGVLDAPKGERFEAVVRNGQLFLCELFEDTETCTTTGVPLPQRARVQLYGVISNANPPRGSFALSLDGCTGTQVLRVTRPFTNGPVAGAVGCMIRGNAACSMTFDNAVLFTRPE